MSGEKSGENNSELRQNSSERAVISLEVAKRSLDLSAKSRENFRERHQKIDHAKKKVQSSHENDVRMADSLLPEEQRDTTVKKEDIKSFIKEREEMGQGSNDDRMDIYRNSINSMDDRYEALAYISAWVDDYNDAKLKANPNFNTKSIDELKNDQDFIEYVNKNVLKEIEDNFQASVSVEIQKKLDLIIVKDKSNKSDTPDKTDKQKEKLNSDLSTFVEKNRVLMASYNSFEGKEDKFKSLYKIDRKEFKEKMFVEVFAANGVDVKNPEIEEQIDELFKNLTVLCEEAQIAVMKFNKRSKKFVSSALDGKEWDKDQKDAEDELKKETEKQSKEMSESATVNVNWQQYWNSGRKESTTTGNGYSIENGKLKVDVVPEFKQDVKVIERNGETLIGFEDHDADSGLTRRVEVKPSEMAYWTAKLTFDWILNHDMSSIDFAMATTKSFDHDFLNSVVNDHRMMNIATKLIPSINSRNLTREDCVVMKNLFSIILNNDDQIPYLEQRVLDLQNALTADPNLCTKIYQKLDSRNNQTSVRALTVSDLKNL